MKYYYFENGKVWLSYNKIPDNGFDYTTWFYSRLPCEINESEIMKIYVHLFPNLSYNKQDATPIDITDIVFEKDGKIYFKKPQRFGNTEQVNLNIEKMNIMEKKAQNTIRKNMKNKDNDKRKTSLAKLKDELTQAMRTSNSETRKDVYQSIINRIDSEYLEIEKNDLCKFYVKGREEFHLDWYPEKHALEEYNNTFI